ncbi:TSC22 domain family protein 1 isoform 3, partial [Silurus asotus]
MHHSESTGDSPGTKRRPHASAFTSRRGSNTLSGGTSASLNAVNMNCNALPTDDHQSSLLIHQIPSAGSPGPHHPATSLNIHTQSQSHQSAGAQIKKKSGFQITSVMPAQVSASTNNSLADDTESYDDIDESHTEDLSYSDILDVSVSRATDTGLPEKSSSEETLNSIHGGETPGVVSPNEAVNPHLHSGQTENLVNGTVHHNHHPPEHHKDQGVASMAVPQPIQGVPVCSALLNSSAPSGDAIVQSDAPAESRTQRSTSVQAADVDISATGIVNQTLFSASDSTNGVSGLEMPGSVIGLNGTSLLGTIEPVDNTMMAITITGSQPLPVSSTTQVQASTAIASRFRVVKLDSTEPFRKGRWMCTEYFVKEAPTAAPFTDVTPTYRAVDNLINSESESTSESSCTTMSGAGDKRTLPTQQTFVQPAVPVQPNLSQTSAQHSQDTGIHTTAFPPVAPSENMQVVPVPGTDCQAPPSRIQEQIPYMVKGHTGQLQNGYPVNQQPSMLMTQALQSVDYAQISLGIQAPAQSHEIPSVQSTITSKATPGCVQTVFTRPQVAVPHIVLAQESIRSQVQQQQQTNQPPKPNFSATGQTAPSMTSSFLQSNIQSGIPLALPHGVPVGGHPGGLELHQREGQSTHLSLARGHYSGKPLPASQLEDARRLLLQHQCLFSLPRLATGSVSLLSEQSNSEGSASEDASAFVTSTGTDEDSHSSLPGPEAAKQHQTITLPPPYFIVFIFYDVFFLKCAVTCTPDVMGHMPFMLFLPSSGFCLGTLPCTQFLPRFFSLSGVINTDLNQGNIHNAMHPNKVPRAFGRETGPQHHRSSTILHGGHEVLFGILIRQTHLECLLPKSSILVSSDQSTRSQLKSQYRLANSRRLRFFSGVGVVAIDNKIEQAMDLVKSHLMYAVREEVEVLKEQIKELIERNSQLEQENHLLKNLASPEQLAQFKAQVHSTSPTLGTQTGIVSGLPTSQTHGSGPPV